MSLASDHPNEAADSSLSTRLAQVAGLLLLAVAAAVGSYLVYRMRMLPVEKTASEANLKQIGLAVKMHEEAQGAFPAAYTADRQGRPLLSWRVRMLPYLDDYTLYRELHLDEPWDSPHNRQFHDRMPPQFQCPGVDLPPGYTAYLAVRGSDSAFAAPQNPLERARRQVGFTLDQMRDGTVNIIAIVEVNPDRAVPWMKPDDFEFDPTDPTRGLGEARGGSFLAIFVDGQPKSISTSIDRDLLIDLFGKDNWIPPPTFPYIPMPRL